MIFQKVVVSFSGCNCLNCSFSFYQIITCLIWSSVNVFIGFLVSGGLASLVDGSYEYYHYLQDGFDDSVCVSTFYLHILITITVFLD